MNTSITRALLTVGATSGALLLSAGSAFAHVSVVAPGAEQGGYAVLTFQVPTESETAGTTGLTVTLPSLSSARTEPLPGWQSRIERNSELAAVSVTWTADPGVSVPPGQFQRFVVSAGPLPNDAEVSFDATQTYSDGSVVDWNQPMADGAEEPEHPAPTLTLAEGTGDGGSGHHSQANASGTDHDDAATDNTARYLGGAGLALGALGAALGIGAAVRGRKS